MRTWGTGLNSTHRSGCYLSKQHIVWRRIQRFSGRIIWNPKRTQQHQLRATHASVSQFNSVIVLVGQCRIFVEESLKIVLYLYVLIVSAASVILIAIQMLREPSSTGLAHPQEGVAPLSAALASFSLCCVTPRPFTRWIHRDWRNRDVAGGPGRDTHGLPRPHLFRSVGWLKKTNKKKGIVFTN